MLLTNKAIIGNILQIQYRKIYMWKILQILKKHLSISIAVSMVLGLVVGGLFQVGFLKNLILPLTILMIYPAMVTLKPLILPKVFCF